MSSINWPTQGENVRLGLSSTIVSSTASQSIGLFDADNNPRVLLSTERLIIDNLTGDLATGIAYILAVNAGASAVDSSTVIGVIDATTFLATLVIDTKEGISLPVGVTPSVLGDTPTAGVTITGAGRITEGKTQGVRPKYREATTYA